MTLDRAPPPPKLRSNEGVDCWPGGYVFQGQAIGQATGLLAMGVGAARRE